MYEIEWHPEAREDLLVKVPRHVARTLVQVANTALDQHYPPDGGSHPPLYWRRGITPECRAMLDEHAEDVPDTGDNPWDYVIYYKRTTRPGKKYEVLKVASNSECMAAFVNLADLV